MGFGNTYKRLVQPDPIRVRYTGSDTLLPGYALCYDHDNAAGSDAEGSDALIIRRGSYVEKPSLNNINHFAGIVVDRVIGNGSAVDVWVLPPTGMRYPGVQVYTDENVAAGDLLAPVPETYAWGRAVVRPPLLVATDTVNRSATNGLCAGTYGYFPWDHNPAKLFRVFEDFLGDKAITLGGFTPAEVLQSGLMVSGASVAAAYTSDPGGRLVMTPNGTTIAQLNYSGITASTATCLPFTLAAGKSCFFRANVNFGVGAVDNDVFCGLAIAGAAISDGTVPPLDDYLGFYMQGDSSALINIATNRDNGTDNVTSTGVSHVADTMRELAFLVRNRLSGDAASATTVHVFVDGVLTNTLSSAAVNALINKDEAMGMVFAGIGGASAVALEIDRWECAINL